MIPEQSVDLGFTGWAILCSIASEGAELQLVKLLSPHSGVLMEIVC